MSEIPLITHDQPEAVLAWHRGRPISAAQFLAHASALAAALPNSSHLLNLCNDRYYFSVLIAAALLRGSCSLLPPTQAPEVRRQLQQFAADVVCMNDRDCATYLAAATALPPVWPVPRIPAEQLATVIFTSGTTGKAVPHARCFGNLVRGVRAGAERLAAAARGGYAILGTVPPQHMFGFESTVLLPLQSAGSICAERPLFPADIASALGQLPRPRALSSAPVHLRALLESEVALPALDLIICATAPLQAQLARQVELRYEASLIEIYGTTETGQIATRRTAEEQAWTLLPGVRLSSREGQWWVQGGHVAEATHLADALEPVNESCFLLHGRTADLVNVAGKRSSLAYLSHQLAAIPGVLDAAFFVPEEDHTSLAGVTRLSALVVAPQLETGQILAALRDRIDPVFLPRPLLRVERLPRNGTGKLPQQALQALAGELAAGTAASFE